MKGFSAFFTLIGHLFFLPHFFSYFKWLIWHALFFFFFFFSLEDRTTKHKSPRTNEPFVNQNLQFVFLFSFIFLLPICFVFYLFQTYLSFMVFRKQKSILTKAYNLSVDNAWMLWCAWLICLLCATFVDIYLCFDRWMLGLLMIFHDWMF